MGKSGRILGNSTRTLKFHRNIVWDFGRKLGILREFWRNQENSWISGELWMNSGKISENSGELSENSREFWENTGQFRGNEGEI